MAQAVTVAALLRAVDPSVEIEVIPIKTSGDRGERERLGAFVREIQEALLEDRVDIALHCLKDLPTEEVPGLKLAAYLKREDPRDALISRFHGMAELAHGAVVGTGSVRRTSQIAAVRPDLRFKPLVGNIDTRLRKLLEGEYDAIILAMAGPKRLGLLDDWSTSEHSTLNVCPLSTDEMLPAPGQAVLTLETRVNGASSSGLASRLNDPSTAAAAIAERAFLRRFGGGCSVPVAALATTDGDRLDLKGLVAGPDGRRVLKGTHSGLQENAEQIGLELAERLGGQGGFELVSALVGVGGTR